MGERLIYLSAGGKEGGKRGWMGRTNRENRVPEKAKQNGNLCSKIEDGEHSLLS